MDNTNLKLEPSLRVLIVDDYPDERETLRILLAMSGYVAETAEGGAAAVAAAAAFRPDVVLMDLAMPGTDGYETARRIRLHPELSRIAFVALTGHGRPSDHRRSREEGFAGHVVKPADFREIRACAEHGRGEPGLTDGSNLHGHRSKTDRLKSVKKGK